jgi:phosphate:Na+ symporter
MEQVIKELIRMSALAKATIQDAEKTIFEYDERLIAKVRDNEQAIDDFQNSITRYLIKISEKHLDTRESGEYPVILHSVNDIEKLGDYASNLIHYAEVKHKKKIVLDADGTREIKLMFEKLYELIDIVVKSLQTRSREQARLAMPIEDEIDEMKSRIKEAHIERLRMHDSRPDGEMMIMDMASNIEKMGDHLFSIAKAVVNDLQWGKRA